MIRLILGLGNPGGEYANTRHNTGRDAAMYFAEKHDFGEFEADKKSNSLLSRGKVGKSKILVGLPETFMNKSGVAAAKLFKAKKENTDLVVMHDDLDIQLGRFKISYGKNSGGHKGVESVMRALKTKNFVRIRIGISPKIKNARVSFGPSVCVVFLLKNKSYNYSGNYYRKCNQYFSFVGSSSRLIDLWRITATQ